jgi:hypothetical protein
MDRPVLASTFLLTLLLAIGLFFFIRASVKDRTQQMILLAAAPETTVLEQLQDYFSQRSYRIARVDAEQNQVTYTGFVRPSWFLAIFLSLLAAVGLLCLGLVLAVLFPQLTPGFWGLPLLSPVAGLFYWKKAGRPEEVSLRIESASDRRDHNRVTITAHRDELIALQQSLPLFKPVEK